MAVKVQTEVPRDVHRKIVKLAKDHKSTVRNVARVAVEQGLGIFDPARLRIDGRRERTA